MATDSIDIWHGYVAVDDKSTSRYWHLLDQDEQIHAGKIKNALFRHRYIEVHGRLRKLLSQLLNQAPEKIAIKKTAFGKPYLADYPELVFNLSHSGDAFLIAVGYYCQLGADLEHCQRRVDFSALVNKCFAEEEITYWNRLPEEQKKIAFYRLWTRKEAFVKAVGRGLALGLKQCIVNPQHPAKFLSVPAGCGSVETWRLVDFELGQDSCGAIAIDKSIAGIRLLALEP